MSINPVDQERHIVPRWREVLTTAQLGELDSTQPRASDEFPGSEASITDKLTRWNLERSSAAAADLVSAALVLNRPSAAQDAAEFLIRTESDATNSVKRGAETLLCRTPQPTDAQDVTSRARIRRLRIGLRDQPRNAIAWVELSRQYAIIGEERKAREAMFRAVSLVEGNRYVLRSAARLFVHLDDAETADELLLTRDMTRSDPWLLSAEIAVAGVARRRSPFVKRARTLIADQNIDPRHLAELVSALATLEFENGSDKAAKKLFRQSLAKPTDNAVAQAEWATRRIDGIGVPDIALAHPRAFEAKAWHLFKQKSWQAGLLECEQWLLDEPFSSRPAVAGSYFALIATSDYRLAEQFARRGLQSSPDASGLLNNLTVALADQGRLDEAEETFKKIGPSSLSLPMRIVTRATEGLLHFRRGRIALGRERYLEAIELSTRSSQGYLRALASAHLVREEEVARTPEAEGAWKLVPPDDQLRDLYPDVAMFIERVASLRELRRRDAALRNAH